MTATPSHSAAVAVIGPDDADAADGHQVTLADNAVTTITVTVTAQDGATRKVYTVAVTRGSVSASDDATLSALTVSPTDIIGFDSDVITYHVGVANSVTQATITATTTGTNATIDISSTGHQVTLSEGLNTVPITVTAEDGSTEQVYTIYVGRGVTADFGWKASDDFNGLVAAGNTNPSGIWSNGATMWVSDAADRKIYAFNAMTKARDTSKDFNTLDTLNIGPRQVWSDGETMWVTDGLIQKIFAYNAQTKARDAGKDFNTLVAAGNVSPKGIWSDGTTMWVADLQDDKIYAYNAETKAGDASKEFDTLADAGNTDPRGIWSDGATMWVSDRSDDKIYAYNMATKERDAAKDFDTLADAGNTDPRGIWSDGETMWVSDSDSDKIYSYNMPPSDDATLSALTVSPTDIIGFASDTTTYHVGVANSVTQATVTATTNDANATIAWSTTDAGTAAGHQVTLSEGLNTVTITVTAEDTNTEKAYTIHVGRGVTADYGWKAVDDFNGLVAAGNTFPLGIWSYGATMWVVDNVDEKIYAYNAVTRARDIGKDFDTLADAGNTDPYGIWSDGETMWVADLGEDKLYAYNLASKARDAGKEFNTLFAAGNTEPRGIWSDGATMWVADYADSKIYAYNLATKEQDSGKEFNTLNSAGNTTPTGIWSDGATMWVADGGEDKIYAYNLATKAQDSGKEFNTLFAAGNTAPRGIWSDGDTMWVADATISSGFTITDAKIYSYNMPPSANAFLRELSLSGITLNEDFAADRTAYTATATAASTTVTATPSHSAAVAVIGPADSDAADGHQVTLADNAVTTITVTVTAQDGATRKVYTVAVTRGSVSASTDATLSALTVRPTDIIGFASDVTTYHVGVANSVEHLTITATANDPNATIDISGTPVASGEGHQVNLSEGLNAAVFRVTAEDGSTTEDYSIFVGRGVTTAYGWKATDDFNTLAAAGNDDAYGLWSDGATMWVADRTDGTIYAYHLTTKVRDAGMDYDTLDDAGNDDPTGIWANSTTMWVADGADGKIYAYNRGTKARDTGKDFDTLDDAGNDSPKGIWSNGETMWVADFDDGKIYAYTLETKLRDSDKDFNTLTASDQTAAPEGIWSNGETMWVGDANDIKLYAYTLATKARDSGKEFNTLIAAENGGLSGLWSNGTTMWAANYGNPGVTYPKIYSYNMPALSGDATLSALTVSPTDIIGFDSDVVANYHVGVANSVTQVTITATANNANATINIGGTDVTSGAGHLVSLSEGLNTVTITVTAENANEEEYFIFVGRGVTTDFGWKADDDFNGLRAAANTPYYLWSDGTTMWVSDFGGSLVGGDKHDPPSRIYAYSVTTKERVPQKELNDLSLPALSGAFGIWSNGETMWVLERISKNLYAYNLVTKRRDDGKDIALVSSNSDPTGIWSNGETMWVMDSDTLKLYAYDLSTRQPDNGKDFPLAGAPLSAIPQSVWSDGATMWISDRINAQIIAYNLDTRARDTGKEFTTLSAAGNTKPTGIWSDGETMYVTDRREGGGKIYAYNMPPSAIAYLESISVNGLPVSGVNPLDTEYTHTVAVTETTVTVAAQPAHAGASVTSITPADSAAAAGHQVALNPDRETPTEVTITVTAENGMTTRTYTVSVEFRPKDAPPELQTLKLVYRPAVEHVLIGSCPSSPGIGITCALSAPGTTAFNVNTGTVDAVTLVANAVSEHATVSIDYADFDPNMGGHQVKLAGLGTSGITIKVTVTNRDGATATYRINVTRQLSGDTRLGELSLTKTGDGAFIMYESIYTDPDSRQRLESNLEPEFITEWNEATGQPRRARYRATLLFTRFDAGETAVLTVGAKELHAGAVTHISATDVDGLTDLFDADRNAEGFQIALSDAVQPGMTRVVINVRAERFVRPEHNDSFHDYELVIVKRFEPRPPKPDPVLAEALKGVNDYYEGVSLFVDWRDGQSCDKAYNVATEYISDTRQGWFNHPVTNHDQDGDPALGNAGIKYQQMTHRWLDSESLEAAFGPATAERSETTIEVWCGPRPHIYKDEDGNDQEANGDSREVGKATIEFPDAPPAPPEPTVAPETPTGLAGRLQGNEATLTWDTVAGASGYELSIKVGEDWMLIDPAEFKEKYRLTVVVGEGTATMSPLYDSGFEFRVRAVNDIGASDWSEAATLED